MAVVSETTVDREARILEEIKEIEGSNLWIIVFRRIKRDQMGMLGFWIVLALVTIGIVAFLLLQYDALFGLKNPTGDPWDNLNYYVEFFCNYVI